MKLTLSPYLYNPIYWHLKNAFNKPELRYIFFYGGSSAGKTYSAVQLNIDDTLGKPSNTLVFRKQLVDISDSIYKDYKLYGERLNQFVPAFEFKINRINIQSKEVRFRGIADIENMKGLSSFKRIYLNELTQFDFNDFKMLRKRLRGQEGQQIIGDWNPIYRSHWIKKKVLDLEEWVTLDNIVSPEDWADLGYSEDKRYLSQLDEGNSFVKINERGNMLLIKTTYKDNFWINGSPYNSKYGRVDQHVLDEYEYDRINEPEDYDVYALGEWGYISKRQIIPKWNEIDEVPKTAKRIPSGLDFGFNPNPSAFIDVYIQGNNIYLDERIYKTDLVNVDLGTDQNSIERELNKINFSKEQCIIADTEGKSVAELRERGYTIWTVKKPPGSVRSSLKMLKSYNIFATKRSNNIKYEFENHVYQEDKNGEIIPEPVDKDNHAIAAARYVLLMKGKLW